MSDRPNLRNDVHLKEDLYCEPYLIFNMKRGQRSKWTQLRSGTLPLAIEDRYTALRDTFVFVFCVIWGIVEHIKNFISCPIAL